MALICPHCKAAEAIAYVENEDGKTLFPCLACELPPGPGPTNTTSCVTAPCATQGCGGEIEDHYRYGAAGRVLAVYRQACGQCGSSRTGGGDAADPRSRAMPQPRL
ncbi:hypothetical protein GA0115259_1012811 [Streptomyces sp. MnatMP-M17]|nr:hypothetical protein GA0115259_1012811 [Streptomyces sp. MnatMP-M17]